MGQDGNPEDRTAPPRTPDNVAKLKQLLFDDEAETIKGLAQRVETVFERAGSDDQLRSSVARVLDGALIDAEKTRHEQVSRAMAPMVVKTVKAEFLNSQDELVEAIYPITGRMVKAYVATAMRDLANEINRKLENNSAMLRVRSLLTGRPVSDLAISDSQRLQVEELYLIRRGSGELLMRWPEGKALSNTDIHLSGVLTAINDFAAHTFQKDGGSIRDFSVDDFSMFLRASPNYLLAAKCSGIPASGIQSIIDEEFLGLLERIHAIGADQTAKTPAFLGETKQSLDTRIKTRFDQITAPLPFRPLKVLGRLLMLALIAGGGWWAFTAYEANQTRNAAAQVVAGVHGLNPDHLDLKVGYRGRSLTLSGLSPAPDITTRLMSRLSEKLPTVTMSNRLLTLPASTADAEIQIARLRRELASVEIGGVLSTLTRMITRARQRLTATLPSIGRIEELQEGPAAKKEVRQARVLLEQSVRELTSYQGAIESAPRELGALKDLDKPLQGLAGRLRTTSGLLTKLLDGSRARTTPEGATFDQGIVSTTESIASEADLISALAIALAVPRGPQKTARQKLQDWISNNAFFFSEGATFRSGGDTVRKLDELAALIRADSSLIRIVGYTDERGSLSRNDSIALARAEQIRDQLVRRNIPAARLMTLGRATGPDLSSETGANSPNRRVQIELSFIDERTP